MVRRPTRFSHTQTEWIMQHDWFDSTTVETSPSTFAAIADHKHGSAPSVNCEIGRDTEMHNNTMEARFYADNEMVNTPPQPCDWKVGDVVKFTNDCGVEFEPLRIIGFAKPEHELHGRFVHLDTDAPWFPVRPESLVPA